jgi:hypothetical protein
MKKTMLSDMLSGTMSVLTEYNSNLKITSIPKMLHIEVKDSIATTLYAMLYLAL